MVFVRPKEGLSETDIPSEGPGGDSPSINPALLELRSNMCCCWFDTTQYECWEHSFRYLFSPFPGMFHLERLARANGCVIYGVRAVTRNRGDIALVNFPKWVNLIQPIGPEQEDGFFSRVQGLVLRSQAEALPGHSVTELLSPGLGHP